MCFSFHDLATKRATYKTDKRLAVRFRCLENVEYGKSVAPSLRLMQRIIDAQPEISINAWTNAVVGGAARIAGGVGRKDEILETLDKDRSLLKLLVDVSRPFDAGVLLHVALKYLKLRVFAFIRRWD